MQNSDVLTHTHTHQYASPNTRTHTHTHTHTHTQHTACSDMMWCNCVRVTGNLLLRTAQTQLN